MPSALLHQNTLAVLAALLLEFLPESEDAAALGGHARAASGARGMQPHSIFL